MIFHSEECTKLWKVIKYGMAKRDEMTCKIKPIFRLIHQILQHTTYVLLYKDEQKFWCRAVLHM